MKLRYFPKAVVQYPRFVLRHGHQMLAHTFRGSSWRSALGLESSREVFKRYKEIRRTERNYLSGPTIAQGDPDQPSPRLRRSAEALRA